MLHTVYLTKVNKGGIIFLKYPDTIGNVLLVYLFYLDQFCDLGKSDTAFGLHSVEHIHEGG